MCRISIFFYYQSHNSTMALIICQLWAWVEELLYNKKKGLTLRPFIITIRTDILLRINSQNKLIARIENRRFLNLHTKTRTQKIK